jgi:hypothetical protein
MWSCDGGGHPEVALFGFYVLRIEAERFWGLKGTFLWGALAPGGDGTLP